MTDKEILQLIIKSGGWNYMDAYRVYSRQEINELLKIELPEHILYVQRQLDVYGWISENDSDEMKRQWGLENNIMKG